MPGEELEAVVVSSTGAQSMPIKEAKLEADVSGKWDRSDSYQKTTNMGEKAWTEELSIVMVGGAVLFTTESVMESVITTGVAVAVTGPGRTVVQCMTPSENQRFYLVIFI